MYLHIHLHALHLHNYSHFAQVTKHVNAEMKQKYEHQKAHDPELLAKEQQKEIMTKEKKRSYNNRIKEKGRLESDIYNDILI